MTTWRLAPRGLRFAIETGALSAYSVDLSNVEFVTPGGMVGLACTLEKWTSKYGALQVILPNEDITAYMHRMDFFDHFKDRLSLDRDVGHLEGRSRHHPSLSELHTVHDLEDVTEITSRFCETLSSRDVPTAKVRNCFAVISETLNNAVDHASSPCGAYTAIQTWSTLDKVAVAVADAGVGVPHTIGALSESYGKNLEDHDLVKLAASHLVSSRQGEEGRGGGLTSALNNVHSGNGQMVIWSGQGWVEFRSTSIITAAERAPTFAGTCVEAIFPIS